MLVGAAIIVGALITTFVGFQWRSERLLRQEIEAQARAFTYEILAVRQYVARHSGVYVPESDIATANPYLQDIPGLTPRLETADGTALVLQNPERVTRLIAQELTDRDTGVRFRLFSDRPLNPANTADSFELRALEEFRDGAAEWWEYADVQGDPYLRYVTPVYVTESCLVCHAQQGYQIGELRGGITVEVRAEQLLEEVRRGRMLVAVALCAALFTLLVALYFVLTRLFGRLLGAESQLRDLASTDALTRLDNRRMAMRRLTDEVERAKRTDSPLTAIMLDLDHFKDVNDTFGHSAGDDVLVAAARTLSSEARAYDVVARLGGEEFLVLMPGAALEQGIAAAERMRAGVASATAEVLRGRPVTVSAGVAEFEPGGEAAEDLLVRADRALYRAKDEGRDRVCTSVR